MALALPLILSMSMWTNLASSVPFADLKTQPLLPPEVEVLTAEETSRLDVHIEVSPSGLIINHEESAYAGIEYAFSKIAATDSVWFQITSNNARFTEQNGKMVITPFEKGSIKMVFKENMVWRPLFITIMVWLAVIGYFSVVIFRKKKISNL